MIVSKVLFDNFKKLLYNIYVIRKKETFLWLPPFAETSIWERQTIYGAVGGIEQ